MNMLWPLPTSQFFVTFTVSTVSHLLLLWLLELYSPSISPFCFQFSEASFSSFTLSLLLHESLLDPLLFNFGLCLGLLLNESEKYLYTWEV